MNMFNYERVIQLSQQVEAQSNALGKGKFFIELI